MIEKLIPKILINGAFQTWEKSPNEDKINELIDQVNRQDEAIRYLAKKAPIGQWEDLTDQINQILNP